jgi:glyoxylase-like metal-dependent hydrolase (beta-lactamase superfamily II)
MVGHVTSSSARLLDELPSWVTLIRAPNPGPMTLDGTNTWVLCAPGSDACVVVDPGPLHEGHLAAVARQGSASMILATHNHPDHVEGLPRFRELAPAAATPQAAVSQAVPEAAVSQAVPEAAASKAVPRAVPSAVLPGVHRVPSPAVPLPDGTTIAEAGPLVIRAYPTPGHTRDSVCFVAECRSEAVVLTGDTILGRGTTVVAHPDGHLGQYLDSLNGLTLLGPLPVLPGHGPALADCAAAARFYLEHRIARLEQVRAARQRGAETVEEIVRLIYFDVDRSLWPAAELSVRAQLAYLTEISEMVETPSRLDSP